MIIRTRTIRTNLYELISALHDEHGGNPGHIAETIDFMAASGKIRWLIESNPSGYLKQLLNEKEQKHGNHTCRNC